MAKNYQRYPLADSSDPHFLPDRKDFSGSGSTRQRVLYRTESGDHISPFLKDCGFGSALFWEAGSSVADPDPGLGAFLTPGSGMGESQHPDPGSGMNNPDHIF